MHKPYLNGRPTHCQYRGCMKPLCATALKGIDNRFYCDEYCEECGIEYNKRQSLETAARMQ